MTGASIGQQIAGKKEVQNASQYPRMFFAKHMQPGLCRYVNPDGTEDMLLIEHDALMRMAPSFVGKPVYIEHPSSSLDQRLPNLKEEACGYVTESFYNEFDGWMWVKFILIDDDAYDCVGDGWSVSNAYVPTERNNGGVWHNVPYTSEVTNADFTSLAIVPDPRYEDACILTPEEYRIYNNAKRERQNELRNSKGEDGDTKGTKTMSFKIFKSTRQEVSTIDADTEIELQNGKTVKIADMVADLEKAQAEQEKLNSLNTASVMVAGKKMTVKELVELHNAMCAEKMNADDDDKKDDEDGDDKEKKNDTDAAVKLDMIENAADDDDELENEADDGDDDKGEPDADNEKKNAKAEAKIRAKAEGEKNFRELKNANRGGGKPTVLETTMDQVARGKARYGSAVTKH